MGVWIALFLVRFVSMALGHSVVLLSFVSVLIRGRIV